MNEEMMEEFIKFLDEKDQKEFGIDDQNLNYYTMSKSELLQNIIFEKRINLLLKKKLLHLETIVRKKREEKEVKNFYNQYFEKDIYLKNQVIYSNFHQGLPEIFYLDKKTKNTRKKNNK